MGDAVRQFVVCIAVYLLCDRCLLWPPFLSEEMVIAVLAAVVHLHPLFKKRMEKDFLVGVSECIGIGVRSVRGAYELVASLYSFVIISPFRIFRIEQSV